MKCPYCGSNQVRVTGKRKDIYAPKDINIRYRKCLKCGKNFKTFEKYSAETLEEVKKWNELLNCESSTK